MILYTVPEVLCAGRELVKQHPTLSAADLIDVNNQVGNFDLYLICAPSSDELVIGCAEILKKNGLRVYIERFKDTQFTAQGHSVAELKSMLERMNKARLCLFATTEELLMPWWLIWMLGMFDGCKPGRSAIWPISVSYGDERINEPLYALYPIICHKTKQSATTEKAFEVLRTVSINDFILKNFCWGFAT